MALNALGLGMVFTAKDLASGTIKQLSVNFNKFSDGTERAAKRLKGAMVTAAAGVGLLVAGVGTLGTSFALANQAGQFEEGVAKVGAISRASSEAVARLAAAAKEAGIRTQFSPTEAIDGLQRLAAQGFNATESIQLLTPALDLAAGGQIGIADASIATAAAMKVFSLNVGEGAVAVDKLLRITNLTALQAPDLGLALGTVSRGAIAAKQSLDEMLPSVGLVKNAGVDTSVAASSVSSALQFVAKNAKAFKDVGVSVTDATGKFRPFLDVVRETDIALNKRFTDGAERTAKGIELFGRFGVVAFTNIANQLTNGIKDAAGQLVTGAEAIQFLRNQMSNAEGAAAEFREKLLDTFEGQKKLLRGVLQTLGISLGETFAKAFKPIVGFLFAATGQMVKLIEGIPVPVKAALGKAALAFGAFATAAGVFTLIKAALVLLAPAIGAIVGSFVLMAQIGAVIGVVVGTIALAFKGYSIETQNASNRTNVLTNAWNKLKLGAQAVFALLTGNPVSAALVSDLNRAENAGVKRFVESVGRLLNRVDKFVDGISSGFREVFSTSTPVFKVLFTAFNDLAKSLGFVGDAFTGMSKTSVDAFFTVGFRIGEFIANTISVLVQAITGVIKVVTFMINNFDRFIAIVKLAGIAVGTLIASVAVFKGLMLGVRAVVATVSALKAAWAFITNAQNLAMIRLNAALLITQVRAKATAIAIGILKAVKVIWGAIMSGNIIKLTITNAKLLIMRGRALAAAAAQTVLSASALRFGAVLLGKAGLIALAGAAGFAFGSWLDETLKLSDGLANLIGDITGLNSELDELDRKAGGRTNRRGAPQPRQAPNAPTPTAPTTAGPVVVPPNAVPGDVSAAVESAQIAANATTTAQVDSSEIVAALKQAGMTGPDIARAMQGLTVEMDGAKVGQASMKGNRSESARTFNQVQFDTVG